VFKDGQQVSNHASGDDGAAPAHGGVIATGRRLGLL